MKVLQWAIISLMFFTGLFSVSVGYAQQPNVTIVGKTYDDFTSGVTIHSDLAKLGRTIYHSLTVKPDSTFEIEFYLPEPSEIIFNNLTVLCTPGDSVDVIIRGSDRIPVMEFTGRGSSIYNFMNDLSHLNIKNSTPNFMSSIKSGEIEIPQALEIVQQRYKQSSELFEKYVSRHHPSEELRHTPIQKYILSTWP